MATTTQRHGASPDVSSHPTELTQRLDAIGWGVFLLMSGILWIASDAVPSGTWLLGTGILLLALTAVRSLKGLAIHGLTLGLGVLALLGGLADLAHVRLPIFALALCLFGVMLIARPMLRR